MAAPPVALTDTDQASLQPPSVLSTLNDDGSRRWLKPRLSPGRFLNARRLVAYFLILLFTALPYIPINGKPAILLDIAARRFTILGYTFLPTDTMLLSLFMMTVFVSVFLTTALVGRVWCGWACPQTVYLEFVFRPIERLFEGSPGRTRKSRFVGSAPAKVLKYVLYLIIAAYLAHTFLSYFVGVEKLRHWIIGSPLDHPVGFGVVIVVTGLMMFDFTFFREQTCLVACPYGRFQSVMLDRNSLIISYDAGRGEPRGHKASPTIGLRVVGEGSPVRQGDCVDCFKCVTTCPTGIDIRNGLQMECVNCAQCIDACDAVMDKLGRPRGLIRYSSQEALAGGKRRVFRARVAIYGVIISALVGAFATVMITKPPADVIVLRGRGAPFSLLGDGLVANPVTVKIINRTPVTHSYTITLEGVTGGRIRAEEDPVRVEAGAFKTVPAMLEVPDEAFTMGKARAQVVISDGASMRQVANFVIVGPGTPRTKAADSHKGVDDHDDRKHEEDHK